MYKITQKIPLKRGKGDLPWFLGNIERVIPIYDGGKKINCLPHPIEDDSEDPDWLEDEENKHDMGAVEDKK